MTRKSRFSVTLVRHFLIDVPNHPLPSQPPTPYILFSFCIYMNVDQLAFLLRPFNWLRRGGLSTLLVLRGTRFLASICKCPTFLSRLDSKLIKYTVLHTKGSELMNAIFDVNFFRRPMIVCHLINLLRNLRSFFTARISEFGWAVEHSSGARNEASQRSSSALLVWWYKSSDSKCRENATQKEVDRVNKENYDHTRGLHQTMWKRKPMCRRRR